MTLPKTELPLDDGPDARPKIAAGRDGKLIVTFATRDDKYNGHAFIARSEDGGKSFSAPMPITTNSPSQRFETATIDEDGRAFLAWIDKRDAAAAKAANKPYAGAALAYAWEDGAGGSLPDAENRAGQHLRVLPYCRVLRRSGQAGGPVPQHLRRRRP